ncbi:MAG: stage II sporulation protein P [Sporolactobacillus sp.]
MYTKHRPKHQLNPILLRFLALSPFILVVLALVLSALISLSGMRMVYIDRAMADTDLSASTLLIETFGNENVFFNQAISKDDRPKSLGHFLTEGLTSLRFDDVRSLFGAELPGFTVYNTKIFYAGQGLNYNTLPKDSPPPNIRLKAPKSHKPDQKEQEKTTANDKLKKLVFIYHTHSWEAYNPALATRSDNPVSADPTKDVIYDGRIVGDTLAAKGIGYVQDTSNKNEELRKRGWTYNEAYTYSRLVVQDAMKANPTLRYFIDIHRDSSGASLTTTTIGSTSYARISIIIGEANANYSPNLYMAEQIKDELDKTYPGLVRGIVGKTKNDGNGIYNQDLSEHAILVEIGGIDNSLDEVKRSSEAFGNALAAFIARTSS